MTVRRLRFGGVVLLAFGMLIAFPFEHRDGAAAKFGTWSAPVNLGAVVNTEFGEFAPHTSKDGLSLYFASTRPAAYGSFGGEDLWVSQRASTDAPWGIPMNLGQVINTAANERSPAISRDGHYLFFATDRPGGFGALDIWVSWRPNSHDDFGWEAPANLGAAINTASTDAGPSFFENDDAGVPHLYIASNRPGDQVDSIFTSAHSPQASSSRPHRSPDSTRRRPTSHRAFDSTASRSSSRRIGLGESGHRTSGPRLGQRSTTRGPRP